MSKFGSYVKLNGPEYLLGSQKEQERVGGNAMMFYLGSPRSVQRVPIENYRLEEFDALPNHIAKENILVHGPYIVNPANPGKQDFAIEFLIKEVGRVKYLGITDFMIHPGSATGSDRPTAIATCIDSIKKVLKATDKSVRFAIETMAGKGNEIGATLDEVKQIVDGVNNERMGIVLDFCHLWDSGVNLKEKGLLVKELKERNLLTLVRGIHVNDSKNDLGAHKDRHANIGEGFIGFETIKELVNLKEFENVIKVLETPWIDGSNKYKEELAELV